MVMNAALADVQILSGKLRTLRAAVEEVLAALGPCEIERGHCTGHGRITRLPCEVEDLRQALGETA